MRFHLLLMLSATCLAQEAADTIYVNGRIVTLWDAHPSAQAFAVRDGRFLAIGSDAEIRKFAGARTKQVDLQGRGVLPGLIDSHTHPIGAELSEAVRPLPPMHTIPEVQRYIKQLADSIPAGQTIHVPKVYSTRLKEQRYPTHAELDQAAPGRVVLLDTGYNAVLSTAALKKLNITRDTTQPKNGRIIKDANGDPTGLIIGAAQVWSPLRPETPFSDADRLHALASMQKRYNAVGITSTIDRGQGADGFRTYVQLHKQGGMTVRTTVTYMISGSGTPQELRKRIEAAPSVTGLGDDWLRTGAIKVVADGGILLGTAYMREPYGTHTEVYGWKEPDYRGELSVPAANLVEMAKTANRLGWQMTAHTAGGAATDLLLDAYEAADREKSIQGRRFAVTHGNFPNPRAIQRAKRLGVAFDVQPAWHHYDGPSIEAVLGPERIRDFLPLKSLFDAGVVIAGGSDHMVRRDSRESINPFNPFFGMWMAITRKTVTGAVLGPEQRITREQALRMWTLNGAYLSFDEKVKGSIEPGKFADFVVISKDLPSCPIDEIKDIEALTTVVAGKTVYQK
jgi:predicted amidohydrolase YtcJ